jgi:hypothetical protein
VAVIPTFVRVMLKSELAVCLLDFSVCGVSVYTKKFIIPGVVAFVGPTHIGSWEAPKATTKKSTAKHCENSQELLLLTFLQGQLKL